MKERYPDLIFDSLVLIMMFGVVISASSWPFETGLFPLVIGIPALLLCLTQLAKDLFGGSRKLSGEGEPKLEGLADVPTERSVPTSLVIRRAGGFYASVIGFYLLVTLFGFHIAIPLFLISFLRFYGNARWPLVIGLTASVLLVTVGIFDQLLHIPWPEPLLKALLSPATP